MSKAAKAATDAWPCEGILSLEFYSTNNIVFQSIIIDLKEVVEKFEMKTRKRNVKLSNRYLHFD